jgi:nucleotide-binding universal stress UspA family protein
VLNVQAPLLHPWPSKLVSPDMIDAELRSEGGNPLIPALAMVKSADVDCVPHVSIGSAAEEIVACAAGYGCDSIMMETRGMGAMEGLVMGSVAQRVVPLAPVPVTLVK